jgi:hypothetical protein
MKKWYLVMAISVILFHAGRTQAQSNTVAPAPVYPQVKGYLSFLIPMVTVNKDETVTEFQKATTIGFPVGINIYYSDRFAFSFELTPSVQWSQHTDSAIASKTSNLLFAPGPVFRFKHSFNIIARLAFETQGRYGFTPVFNKVYLHTRAVNYFVSLSVPCRFGNAKPPSVGLGLQIGFTFN